MSQPLVTDGFISGDGHRTWFEVTGDLTSRRAPVVALHGGPGMAHNALAPLRELAADGWPLVLYDQLGCGRSTHLPSAPRDFWTVDLFLAELDELLRHLGIDADYHLLGHSWGGMLAAEHAVRRPAGLRSLILSDSLASSALWAQGAARLRAELPAEVADVLTRHEAAGTVDDPEYLAACDQYYARHVCRVPMPDFVQATFAQLAEDPTVYNTMWGPNEFASVGTLKNWTIVERLDAIDAPTLVISGEFDAATWECQEPFVERIPNVRQFVVPNASHFAMVEQSASYLGAVRAFLADVDSQRDARQR